MILLLKFPLKILLLKFPLYFNSHLVSTELRTSTEDALRTAEPRGEVGSELREPRFEDDLNRKKFGKQTNNRYLQNLSQNFLL